MKANRSKLITTKTAIRLPKWITYCVFWMIHWSEIFRS